MNTDSKIYPILPYDSNEVFNYFEGLKKDYTSFAPEKRKYILSQIEEMFKAIGTSSPSFNCDLDDKTITVSVDSEFIKKFNAVAQSILILEKNVQGTHVDVSNVLTEIEKTKAAIHKKTEEMIKNIDQSFDQSIDITKENLLMLNKEQVEKIDTGIKELMSANISQNRSISMASFCSASFLGLGPVVVGLSQWLTVGGLAYFSLFTGGIAVAVLLLIYGTYKTIQYTNEYNQMAQIRQKGPEHDQFIKFIEQKNREKISKGLKPLDLSTANIEQLIKEYSLKKTTIPNKN